MSESSKNIGKAADRRKFILVLAGMAIAGFAMFSMSYPSHRDFVKNRYEESAIIHLGSLRNAQLMYRNHPKKGAGEFADSIETLGWTMPDGTLQTNDSPNYIFSTSSRGNKAAAQNPDEVIHPLIWMDHRTAEISYEEPPG